MMTRTRVDGTEQSVVKFTLFGLTDSLCIFVSGKGSFTIDDETLQSQVLTVFHNEPGSAASVQLHAPGCAED